MSVTPDQKRPAVLELAASGGHGTKRTIPCHVEGMQGKRLILSTPEELRESTLVSVEYEDTLLLGEVVICKGAHEAWTTEILVEQILTGLHSLMALREHLLSEGLPAPLPAVPAVIRN